MPGTIALAGAFFVAAALAFMIIAFASPYWVESFEEFKGPFVKLGLWEFCFNDYTFYKDYNGKRYLGCFYVFSDDIRPIWEWVSPPWFIGVQVLVSASLLFIFCTSVILTLYIFKRFPKNLEFAVLLGCGALMALCFVATFIAVIVFGVRKEDRKWVPRPDMNLLSWSYGMCCISMIFCLVAALLLAKAGKQKYDDDDPFKRPPITTYT